MKQAVEILEILSAEHRAQIVADVLGDLPEWFGLPESTQEYIDASRLLRLWAAFVDQQAVGFVTLSSTSHETAEVHCMGVKKAFHRLGLGSRLHSVLETAAQMNYRFLQVKTVDEGHYEAYDQTIHFYRSVGFSKFEVFPNLWDEWNPCLVMIKYLGLED